MADETPDPASNMVPISRLNTKIAKITELEAKVSALEQHSASVATEFNTFRHAATESSTMMRGGVMDMEDQELVRWRYSRLPPEGRPDFAGWLQGEARSDRHLAHLFASSAAVAALNPGPADAPVGSPPASTPPPVSAAPISPPLTATPPVNGNVLPASPAGLGRTLTWWQNLSAGEKAQARKTLTSDEITRGLQGGWPRG